MCAREPLGHLLFPELNARNINRAMRAAFAMTDLPRADRYIARGCRRGCAGTKGTRLPVATVAGAGGWRPLDFRGCVETTAGISRATSKIPVSDYDPDSSDDAYVSYFGCETPLGRSPRRPMGVWVVGQRRLGASWVFGSLALKCI